MRFPYQRVLILGCAGSGKTTFARALHERSGLPLIHLDRIWWKENWEHLSNGEFDEILLKELAGERWIIDGNYRRTLALRLQYADVAVFFDLPQEECLRGAYDRIEANKGKSRPDMGDGCVETHDEAFYAHIKSFHGKNRPEILDLLNRGGKQYFVFTSRKQAYAWLDGFDG